MYIFFNSFDEMKKIIAYNKELNGMKKNHININVF